MFDQRTWFGTFWRGLALLLLVAVVLVLGLAALFILDRLDWIPPLRPENLGFFAYEARGFFGPVRLWETLWATAVLLTLTGLLIWAVLAPLHRWLFGTPVGQYLGDRETFRRQMLWSAMLVFPAFLLTMAWATSGTERALFAWVPSAPLLALTIVLVLPLQCLAEEVLFRGFLQTWFGRLLPSFVLACLAQAVLFGLMHPGQFFASFAMGVALGMAARFFGTLAIPFVFHLANNFTVIAAGPTPFWGDRPLPGWEVNLPLGLPLMVLFSALLMVGICIGSARKDRRSAAA